MSFLLRLINIKLGIIHVYALFQSICKRLMLVIQALIYDLSDLHIVEHNYFQNFKMICVFIIKYVYLD